MDAALTPAGGAAAAPSLFARMAVARAVQAIEAAGPLDDGSAMQQAFAASNDRQQRVLARGWLLGERLGLPAELARWRHLGRAVVLALAVAMALSAWAIAQAVLGEGRRINALAALLSVLGLHALTLGGWALGLLWPGGHGGAGAWSLGALALRLTARLPLDRGPHAAALWSGVSQVLARQRLAPWAFGAVSHTIWTLAFVLIVAALWFGFSFHAYQLTWETTILSEMFFSRFVHASGALPALLGFPVPDAAAIQAAGVASAAGGDQRAWAWWLMGCTVVYGLLPRAVLALLSAWQWRRRSARLRLDDDDPAVRRLYARFEQMEAAQVIDADRSQPAAPVRAATGAGAGGAALIAYELPPEADWPPAAVALPAGAWCARSAGGSAERCALLAQLAATRPPLVLLGVRALSSPDRGTARFLREVQRHAPQLALWLTPDAPASAARRWQDWLQAEVLPSIALLADTAAADRLLHGEARAFTEPAPHPTPGAPAP